MAIKTEITNFLDKTSDGSSQLDRNIDVILYYYGFTGEVGPTLESTGQHFGVTRERVRQILNRYFRDRASLGLLPAITKCAHVVKSRDVWLMSELKTAFEKEIGDDLGTHPLNVLTLIKELNGRTDYDTFDGQIHRISRPAEECFVMHKKYVKGFYRVMKAVRTVPGIVGIVNTAELDTGDIPLDLVRKAITIHEDSWTMTVGDTLVYLYEDRDNFLVNASEKVFSICDEVPLNRLATALANSLRRRSSKFTYPNEQIVEAYIRASRYFSIKDNCAKGEMVSFMGKKAELSPIETNVTEKLKTKRTMSYIELRDHLVEAGYNKPVIDKAVMASAMVFVDKTLGPKMYAYSLVGTAVA